MCGRYTLTASSDALVEAFDLSELPQAEARYNIAPTQEVAIVRIAGAGTQEGAETGEVGRELAWVRWGLIPGWAKDPSIGNRMINARSETVAEKPSFRSAFKRRRCLVAADGFYEWQKQADGSKQPFYLRLCDGRPFGIAGLWERWSKEGDPIESCTLLTTKPNALTAKVHDRMPVILPPSRYALWLDPTVEDRDRLEALLTPYDPEEMEAYPVSRFVNKPGNDSPRCIEAVA